MRFLCNNLSKNIPELCLKCLIFAFRLLTKFDVSYRAKNLTFPADSKTLLCENNQIKNVQIKNLSRIGDLQVTAYGNQVKKGFGHRAGHDEKTIKGDLPIMILLLDIDVHL